MTEAQGVGETRDARAGGSVGRGVIAATLLLVATAVVWWPVLRSGPITDDHHFLKIAHDLVRLDEDRGAARLGDWFAIWGAGADEGAARGHRFYRPVVLQSHALQLWWTGLASRPLMIGNLLIHLAGTLGVFLLARRAAALRWRAAAFVGAIFATSPLAVEPVAWICDRSDTLSLAFGVWALVWSYGAKGADRARVGPAVLCFLALCSKEHAFVYPGVIVAMEWRDLRREGFSFVALLRRCLPATIAVVGWFLVRGSVVGFFETEYHEQGLVDHLRDPELTRRWRDSALLLLAPFDERWRATGIGAIAAPLIAGLTGLATVFGLGRALRAGRIDLLALALLPGLFVLLFGTTLHGVTPMLMNGRLLYTPLVALLVMAAFGSTARRGTGVGWSVAVIATVVLALQVPHLRDRIDLWLDARLTGRTTIESVIEAWEARAETSALEVAVLGYVEQRVFNDSFDTSSDVPLALRPPFQVPAVDLRKIMGSGPRPGLGAGSSLAEALAVDRPRVWAAFRRGDDGRGRVEVVHAGEVSPERFASLSPAAGASLEVAARTAETSPLRISAELEGLTGASIHLGVLGWGDRLIDVDTARLGARRRDQGAGREVLDFEIPLGAAVEPHLAGTTPVVFGWYLEARAPEGEVLGRTRVRALSLQRP